MAGMSTLIMLQMDVASGQASRGQASRYQNLLNDLGLSEAKVAEQLQLYLGRYAEIFGERLNERSFNPLQNLMLAPIETIPLMMIGMGLYKNRYLLGTADRSIYLRHGLWLSVIGGLIMVGLVILAFAQEFQVVWMFT